MNITNNTNSSAEEFSDLTNGTVFIDINDEVQMKIANMAIDNMVNLSTGVVSSIDLNAQVTVPTAELILTN